MAAVAAVQAVDDAQAEADAGSGDVTFEWQGKEFSVLPAGEWRSSALGALNRGDFDLWASKCLTNGSFATWQEMDPTVSEAGNFLREWRSASGQDPKGSSPSRSSSKSTKRR